MTPGPELQAALDAAYDVFARYPRPGALEASPHRDPARILADLSSAPLRDLPGEKIRYYAAVAISTVGDDRAYRHFLPRILDIAVDGGCEGAGVEPESLAGKIAHAGFEGWPKRERMAVLELFDAASRQAIEEPLDQATPEPWLIGLAELGGSASPLLGAWLTAGSINAALHLVEAVRSQAFRRSGHDDPAKSHPEARAVRLWLRSPPVLARLETLLLEVPQDETWRVEAALIESAMAD
ncbi:hypothetical protein AS593_20315 [Caulobacter vibrioides]|nr:hypothetical protein AS593_20315 [Caulobacter vibrioides]